MDVVVADIAPKFGMLLSRSWDKKVGGTLQMDLSYAIIPIFGGENRRLYRELQFAYIFIDDRNPKNHPLYVVEKDLGSCMLHFSDDNTASMFCRLRRKNQSSVMWNKKMSCGKCISMALHPRKEQE